MPRRSLPGPRSRSPKPRHARVQTQLLSQHVLLVVEAAESSGIRHALRSSMAMPWAGPAASTAQGRRGKGRTPGGAGHRVVAWSDALARQEHLDGRRQYPDLRANDSDEAQHTKGPFLIAVR